MRIFHGGKFGDAAVNGWSGKGQRFHELTRVNLVNSFYCTPKSSNISQNDDLNIIFSFFLLNVVTNAPNHVNTIHQYFDLPTSPPFEVGIQGRKDLILSPAIYQVSTPIQITQPHFVILGLGFPTLVSMETCHRKKHHGKKWQKNWCLGKTWGKTKMPISFKA